MKTKRIVIQEYPRINMSYINKRPTDSYYRKRQYHRKMILRRIRFILILLILISIILIGTNTSRNDNTNITNMGINSVSKFHSEKTDKITTPISENFNSSNYQFIDGTLGDMIIDVDVNGNTKQLLKYDLPSKYYDIDFSSYQPFETYNKIVEYKLPGFNIVNSGKSYFDENGFRRSKVNSQYSVFNEDDYVILIGNFYKSPTKFGQRFLIVTTEEMFTVIVGGNISNTDEREMFSYHEVGDETYAGLITWVIDNDSENIDNFINDIGSIILMKGEILHIYQII